MNVSLLFTDLLGSFPIYLPILSFGSALGMVLGFFSYLLGYGVSSVLSLMKNL